MKSIYALALMVAAATPATLFAQDHPHNQTKGPHDYFSRLAKQEAQKEQDEHMRAVLSENAPNEKMPGTSEFAFAGRNNKFYLAIGGYAKFTASYDFGNTLDNPNEFITENISTEPRPGNGGLVQFSAMQTHLCLNFVALPETKNKVGFFIGTNFLDNYSPTLQYAYARWRGLKAGYDYSNFLDPNAGPPTIDYEGPNAMTSVPLAMISYDGKFGKHKEWQAGVALEMPQYSVTTGAGSQTVTQRVPDIPAYIQYSWGGGVSTLRLSGMLRNMEYRDLMLGKNYNKVGWGVQLSGSADINSFLTAYYQAVYGDGIASYIQDLNGGGMDMTPSRTPGKMDAVKAWGAYLGLQYNFSKQVYATTTYSHVRTYASQYKGGETAWGDQYRYAQYAVANVFYQINKHLQTGLEYIYGRRVNYDGSQGHDNRIQAMFQVNF